MEGVLCYRSNLAAAFLGLCTSAGGVLGGKSTVHMPHAIISTGQEDLIAEVRVAQARADARVQSIQIAIRSDYCWEMVVVTMVEYLVELLHRPWGRLLGPQVVYHKQINRAYLLESLII